MDSLWYALIAGLQLVPVSGGGGGSGLLTLLNMDFGGMTSSPETGSAAFGTPGHNFWNYLGWQVPGPIGNLLLADGQTPSGVRLAASNLPGAWDNGSTEPMYDYYIYAPSGQSGTLSFSGLPTGTYNVYAYSFDGNFTLAVGGVNVGTQTTTYNYPTAPIPPWIPGLDYALWSNVGVTAGQPMVLTIAPGHDGYAVISGMQIAQMDANGLPIYWELEYLGQTGLDPNADPDGSGLPLLADYELQTNPTVPDNPLILSTLANGAQVSGYLHLPLGIAAGLQSPPITLYVDGLPAANSCLEQSGGQWYLDWNTVFLPNGTHSLSVAFQYNPDASYGQTGTVFGPSKTVHVANMMTFDRLSSQFTANQYINAAVALASATYQVYLYDDSGSLLVYTQPSSTSGQIQLAWNLTDPNTGQQISFGNIQAAFVITPPGGQPTTVWQWFIKEPPPQPANQFVVAWGWDIYSTKFSRNNNDMIVNGVINLVGNPADPNSYFLAPPGNIPYVSAFRYDTDADKQALLNALSDSSLFFWFGHRQRVGIRREPSSEVRHGDRRHQGAPPESVLLVDAGPPASGQAPVQTGDP